MSKNILIFGAGASYGSDTNTITPPLGENLLDALCQFNPNGWGQIGESLKSELRKDFEMGVISLATQQPHWLPPLQRAMAAFFYNFKPRGTNLYYRLAQELTKNGKWDGAFITLNYDRLLELSLLASAIQPYIGIKPENSGFSTEICLPHGCCHLFCESVFGSANGVSFSGLNVTTNGPIAVVGSDEEFQNRINNNAFPPVMSYFEPNKQTTSGNNFILSQRERYRGLVANADTICLVGIRVREHDQHIWEPLSNSSAKLIYVSGHESVSDFTKWTQAKRGDKNNIAEPRYFADSFEKLIEYTRIKP